MFVGRTISKRCSDGLYTGTITGHSTHDNITLYDVKYTDGDAEQMDLVDVLKHIKLIQDNMAIKRPRMHARLRQANSNDRARIGKLLLPTPTTTASPTPTTPSAKPSVFQTVHKRRSPRIPKPINRLTSSSLGSVVGSNALPLPLATHTPNKANFVRVKPTRQQTSRKRRRSGASRILIMMSMLFNLVTGATIRPPPNAVIDGIRLHRYSTESPPLPDVPPRDVPPPSDFDDAVYGPFRMFWRPVIQREIDSLFKYGVWRLEKLPPGALVLPCKMVFKVKPDGRDPPRILKFKCRYCGKGFFQRMGIHYICSFAPVAAALTTRLVVAIATEMNWPLHGMDVSNAYLNADLDPRIVLFVKPPPRMFMFLMDMVSVCSKASTGPCREGIVGLFTSTRS